MQMKNAPLSKELIMHVIYHETATIWHPLVQKTYKLRNSTPKSLINLNYYDINY